MIRIAVLLSGRGSNFAAIDDAIVNGTLDAEIVCVISNRPDARGIELARERRHHAHIVDHREFPSRAAHEEEVLRILETARTDYIVLAGYMRLLSADFVARYPKRILNIHPSLLPAFPGTDAQAQAVAYGVKVSGCTVHFVTEKLDDGPILVQRCVNVFPEDTADTLSARILVQEHIAYVEALEQVAKGQSGKETKDS